MSDCQHESIIQVSELMVKWGWERCEDGTYEPDETYYKVLDEETLDFTCRECGEVVCLDDNARIEQACDSTQLAATTSGGRARPRSASCAIWRTTRG